MDPTPRTQVSNTATPASVAAQLIERIEQRTAVVGVIGLGYVGLPFAVEKLKAGFRVIGIDQNPDRAAKVRAGQSYIDDVASEELAPFAEAGQIEVDTDFARVGEIDVIVICVPTPLTKNLTPDMSYVESVTRELASHTRPGQLISLESTTYPGTTEELMLPLLAKEDLVPDVDLFLAHSPERVDPGNRRYTTKNTSKVVGAIGANSLEVAVRFYEQTIETVVPVSSASAAELTKVFENTFRAVNIALVNELAQLCDRMDLDVWEVLDAAFTKPFGIMPFYPGPGVGGHCIPIDPHYLEWKAKELDFNTHFIALAGEVNRRMPSFVVEKARRVLNQAAIAPSGARVLVLGAAYKRDLPDARESPALKIIELLVSDRSNVVYHDPFLPTVRVGGQTLESVDLTDEALEAADLVIIATDHSTFDYERIVAKAPRVLDTRNATKRVAGAKENVTRL